MGDAERKLNELLAKGLLRPKPTPKVVSTNDLSADTMRERASRAAREAAETEQRELEVAKERQRKLNVFAAAHWHAVEARWHEQEARRIEETYRGFHSRGD